MAGWRKAIELALSEEDVTRLGAVARSRMEAASRVERARILLAYWEDRSFFAEAQAIGVHHQTVQRCVEIRKSKRFARNSTRPSSKARSPLRQAQETEPSTVP
jgi:hypothetical protein